MATDPKQEREQEVLKWLEKNEYTVTELADLMRIGYYSVLRATNSLLTQQKIVISRIEDRARVYAINPSYTSSASIPHITSLVSRTRHKAIQLLDTVGQEDSMASVQACKDIPKLATELFYIANDAAQGMDVNDDLTHTRKAIQRNFLQLKNAAFIYEQLLQDQRFWNKKDLEAMTEDIDYDLPAVLKARSYYSGKQV